MQICPGCGNETAGTIIESAMLDELSPYCGECVMKYNLNEGKSFIDVLKCKGYLGDEEVEDGPDSAPMSNLTRFLFFGGWILLGIILYIFSLNFFTWYLILTGIMIYMAFCKSDVDESELPLSVQIKRMRARERERAKLNNSD
jgi:hypothetical protein